MERVIYVAIEGARVGARAICQSRYFGCFAELVT